MKGEIAFKCFKLERRECHFCMEQKKDELQGGSECHFCMEQKKDPAKKC